ncbi:MAG: HD family phosphohydrolase, partial [Gammaproteobacteria bacterium]|nr:HD family phosphohydrolase [Gammaproteobacteria bacterium]NIR94150.1 HD family phosphohydrolase [Gammaproteobacteria bacterium]
EDMLAELESIVETLNDPHLKSLMIAFLADKEFVESFSHAPAAKTMHHVYLGGLLEHSLSVAALASDICGRYP